MEQATIQDRVYAAKNNSMAADSLIRDYLPFIKSETSKVIGRIVQEGRDDELSIAMIGFHEAVESYSGTRGAFLKYASVVMRRKLIDYHRSEKRHMGQISIDAPVSGDGDATLADTIKDETDHYAGAAVRDATRQEIAELSQQLQEFGLSLSDIADSCPRQDRTMERCQKALAYSKTNPELIQELKRKKKLPIAALVAGSGVERKTLERHRKYMMALMLIYSNGYEIIRGHLKQVKGGMSV